jgi:hypothetical protein
MVDPVALCGCMFDLSTIDTDGIRIHLKRERLFETNWGLTAPQPCDHAGIEWFAGAYGGARRDKYEAKYVRKGGYVPREARCQGAARRRARHDVGRAVRVPAACVLRVHRRADARPHRRPGRRMNRIYEAIARLVVGAAFLGDRAACAWANTTHQPTEDER